MNGLINGIKSLKRESSFSSNVKVEKNQNSRQSSISTENSETKKRESQNWNESSVWTVESDEDSIFKGRNKSDNSMFYDEAIIVGNSLGPRFNEQANADLIDAVKDGRLHAAVKALSHGQFYLS